MILPLLKFVFSVKIFFATDCCHRKSPNLSEASFAGLRENIPVAFIPHSSHIDTVHVFDFS